MLHSHALAACDRGGGPILGQTARLTFIGCVVGVGLALGVNRLAEGLLFGVAPSDPLVLGAAILVLLCVSLAAACLPGRAAARMDPLEILKGS